MLNELYLNPYHTYNQIYNMTFIFIYLFYLIQLLHLISNIHFIFLNNLIHQLI